ncbi:MAG: hypothetical protein PUD03_10915 [Lachnospiraceae bacterium]|nr:hypothetical protein [Lachnospiraceae bacterium]MDD5854583.1 hypothetical protein [Lachnospiraceae bacterium]
METKENVFRQALKGKKIPILTLDNKWYQLFTRENNDPKMEQLAEELKALVAKQGQINSDLKDIRKLKAKLMDEIVAGIDNKPLSDKEMDEHKTLIEECNTKIDEKQDELLDLPAQIDEVNFELMTRTMDICYRTMSDNAAEIEKIAEWIAKIRIELKKNVIRKQEREWLNQEMYAYMHDIFGPEVIEIFDMTYNPDDNKLKG